MWSVSNKIYVRVFKEEIKCYEFTAIIFGAVENNNVLYPFDFSKTYIRSLKLFYHRNIRRLEKHHNIIIISTDDDDAAKTTVHVIIINCNLLI